MSQNIRFTTKEYLRYKLCARHQKGHGIHSPLVFDFVKNVLRPLRRKVECKENRAYQLQLNKRHDLIEISDHGAGQRSRKRTRTVGELSRKSATRLKYRCLLGKIAQYYNVDLVLEFGTSLGLTTNILANAKPNKKIITVEGCPNIHQIACENFKQWGNTNIDAICSTFDDFIEKYEIPDKRVLIYIDGNHTQEATIRYYANLWHKLPSGSILVIGDIFWSHDMSKAWKEISTPINNQYAVDLFYMGILFKHSNCVGQRHRIRF